MWLGTIRGYQATAMQTARNQEATKIPTAGGVLDSRAAQILARTLYRDMVAHGLGPEQILAVATELIDHVTEELKSTQSASGRA